MIVEENVYLEHFGTKGMRWGVRKHRDEAERAARFSDKTKRNLKIGAGVATAAALTVGTVYATRYVGANGGRLMSQISGSASRVLQGQQAVSAIMRSPEHQRNVAQLNAARQQTNQRIAADLRAQGQLDRSRGIDLPLDSYRWEQGVDWQ